MKRRQTGIVSSSNPAGFTLVELIVVIVIIGIVAGVVGLFVGAPVRGFLDHARRSAMTDAADLALLRLSRDLRAALPNSVRVSGDNAIELLRTLDGERYRVEAPGLEDDRLTPGAADLAFNTFTPLGGSDVTLDASNRFPVGMRLAVYPLGQPGANPWVAADAVMTAAATRIARTAATVGGIGESRLTLSAAHTFPLDSPSRRVFLVDQAVSYLCSGGRLLRYAGYTPQAVQPVAEADFAVGSGVVIVDNVESCALRYAASANSRRNAVARLSIVLMRNDERVSLLRQVHVDNAP